ncbi:MAG: hypothetical protein IT542_10795 [Rubellimicrobium sp.]|nr:hypothetical protein [Rubellimicrobium sp.]
MVRPPRRLRPTVLGWIATLLVASAVLRLGGAADMALAIGDAGAESGSGTGAQTGPACPAPGDAGSLLAALRAREADVLARESAVTEREAALAAAASEVDERLAALAEAEASLTALISLSESAANDDLARLTAVYENMKPRDAAALFETMDPAFSAGFMGMMQPAAAAAIMSGLSPGTAYSISAILAGRNVGAPTR